jgi:pSer/pThr/pTyr-binding forkhead associated (FHA) protein
MKLVFPHKEHKDFELLGDSFTIGSSPEATIQIDALGMGAIHAELVKDGNDFSLKIDNPASMASVNGRLVKEIKEVREGDLMIIAQVHCKIVGDVQKPKDDNRTRIRMALPKFVLRGVSGVYFGKTFPLRGKTSLGRHSDNDIFVNVDGISRKHATITVLAEGLEIEDLGSSNGTFVNGKQITKQTIKIGDEIKLDNIRFLIQSPGMQLDKKTQSFKSENVTNKASVSNSSITKASTSSGSAVKWVVTVIVLLAAAGAGAWYMGLLDKFIK